MEWSEYQTLALRTLSAEQDDKAKLVNGALGLAGEAGEVADTIKKHIFMGHALDPLELTKELGDVLWYVALLLEAADLKMEVVLSRNIRKLENRYPAGFSTEASLNRQEENE